MDNYQTGRVKSKMLLSWIMGNVGSSVLVSWHILDTKCQDYVSLWVCMQTHNLWCHVLCLRYLLGQSQNQALPCHLCLLQCAKRRLSAQTERRVNKGPGSAAQTPPPPGERCSAPSACKINHHNSAQTMQPLTWQFLPECILISTQHTKITWRGGKNYLQKSCVYAIHWMPFYCCLVQQSH